MVFFCPKKDEGKRGEEISKKKKKEVVEVFSSFVAKRFSLVFQSREPKNSTPSNKVCEFLTCARSSSWSLRTSASSPALPEEGGVEGAARATGMRGCCCWWFKRRRWPATTMSDDLSEEIESTTQERRPAPGRRTTPRDAPCAPRHAHSVDLSIAGERIEKKNKATKLALNLNAIISVVAACKEKKRGGEGEKKWEQLANVADVARPRRVSTTIFFFHFSLAPLRPTHESARLRRSAFFSGPSPTITLCLILLFCDKKIKRYENQTPLSPSSSPLLSLFHLCLSLSLSLFSLSSLSTPPPPLSLSLSLSLYNKWCMPLTIISLICHLGGYATPSTPTKPDGSWTRAQ